LCSQAWHRLRLLELRNSGLIDGRVDVFLTADQNLRYQQNLKGRRIAIVELPFIRRNEIAQFVDRICEAIRSAEMGDYIQIVSEG
jgi:hypothetical protein